MSGAGNGEIASATIELDGSALPTGLMTASPVNIDHGTTGILARDHSPYCSVVRGRSGTSNEVRSSSSGSSSTFAESSSVSACGFWPSKIASG